MYIGGTARLMVVVLLVLFLLGRIEHQRSRASRGSATETNRQTPRAGEAM